MDASRWLDTPVITLSGELDICARPSLMRALAPAEDFQRVTIDLRGVTYLDASTLGCLIRLRKHMATTEESPIRLIVRRRHANLLALVRLNSVFAVRVVPDPQTAPSVTPRFWADRAFEPV